MTTSANPDHALADFLARTSLGPRQFHKNLDLWPILISPAGERPAAGPSYVTLTQAMESGAILVDELGNLAEVNNLQVTNRGKDAVLFLFGEEIVGSKQNRVANATFLVAPKSTFVIDVSCVESGRWDARPSRRFMPSSSVLSSQLRQTMAVNVTDSLLEGQGYDAHQAEVWESVSLRTGLMGRRSDTDAYADYRESRSVDLEEMTRGFRVLDGQVGFVASVGGEIAGLEIIGRPEVFARYFDAILRAYAIDAIDAARLQTLESGASDPPRFEAPGEFLSALSRAPAHSRPSLGSGEDLRIEGDDVVGCALVHEEAVVHLTAFPKV